MSSHSVTVNVCFSTDINTWVFSLPFTTIREGDDGIDSMSLSRSTVSYKKTLGNNNEKILNYY